MWAKGNMIEIDEQICSRGWEQLATYQKLTCSELMICNVQCSK